jgi:hypothetical protein
MIVLIYRRYALDVQAYRFFLSYIEEMLIQVINTRN